MSFEYIIEKENKTKQLSKEQASELARKIASDFKKFDDARIENINKANKLIDEIFFRNNLQEEKDKKKKWKAKVKMCKTFEFYQTFKAFIWKNIYSNVNSMFDVSGENQDSDNSSNKQKAVLVDNFEKMEYSKTCDTIIDNSLFYGELISFTAWKKISKQIRRPIKFWENLLSGDVKRLAKVLMAKAEGKNYYIDEKEIYNNPYVYAVNPADFVFDTSQIDDFDNAPKIYKTWKTPEDIINNKLYTVDKETAKAIKDLVKDPSSADLSDQSDKRLSDETSNGNTVEVLEHWGNIKLEDGTLLKNWHAVCVGGKYLVRFKANEAVINPFTYGAFIVDPKTKRGLSNLISILDLALLQEDLMNKTYDMQALNENPPLYAPEGFFDDDEVELYPGKIITFGDGINPSTSIKQMSFNSNIYLQDIATLNDTMSEVSGIFPNMVGQSESGNKSATEISVKAQGQMTRLSMALDTINQYLIIPDVKNVAELNANFKSGIEKIFINKDNKKEIIEIDDDVRQADYKYTYSDRSATADRFNKADMIASAIKEFAQFIPLDVKELFTWYLEQKGVENPERFLRDDVEIPPEVQQVLLQIPMVQQIMQNYENLKAQQGGMPEQHISNSEGVPQQVNEEGAIQQTPEVIGG